MHELLSFRDIYLQVVKSMYISITILICRWFITGDLDVYYMESYMQSKSAIAKYSNFVGLEV